MNSYTILIETDETHPFDLEEIKKNLQVEYDDDDTVIDSKIMAAVGQIEKDTNRIFTNNTFQLCVDSYPCNHKIELPNCPLDTVVWVKYYDTAGTLQTLSNTKYFVRKPVKLPAEVIFNHLLWSPALECSNRPDKIIIQYTTSVDTIDVTFLELLNQWVGHLYQNPDGSVPKNLDTIDRLTRKLKVRGYK